MTHDKKRKHKLIFCILCITAFLFVIFSGGMKKTLHRTMVSKGAEWVMNIHAPMLQYASIEEYSILDWLRDKVMRTVPLYEYCFTRSEEVEDEENEERLIAQMERENAHASPQEVTVQAYKEHTRTEPKTENDHEVEVEPRDGSEEETEGIEGIEGLEGIGETDETEKKTEGDFRQAVLAAYKKEDLASYDYLVSHFYHVDSTTKLSKKLIDFKELFYKDLTVKTNGDEPKILIYHTHSQEGYKKSKKTSGKTVVDVGDYLTKLLEEEYGIPVLHHKGQYDKKDRDSAYSRALPAIEEILKKHPSIEVVIDLHRDGVAETTHLVTEINGKKTATIMYFNGVSYSKVNGPLTYIQNDNLSGNLAFSLQMQLASRAYYPTLTRDIYIKGYRYNMHVREKTLLVEVGAQTNTYEEAINAMEPLADILSKVLMN